MRIVEIEALANGAHRNQSSSNLILPPVGWAIIRDDEVLQNFPFGSFDVEEVDGMTYMVENSWLPGEIPEPEPEPEPSETELSLSERVKNLENAMDALLGGDS
ncbi:MAG: hypothetical protein IKU94_00675 [Bacteroidaceae bacterium]|nr:hypothetical protein [Bacteroidaceae bacterium]MBR4930449.1 hypothetical protein [Bacteroidaceae bacterium]